MEPDMSMEPQPHWKQLRLSLERPYKDDHGNLIPVVEDITPEGQYIYETKESPSARLGTNLRKIFLERGLDFFDKIVGQAFVADDTQPIDASQSPDQTDKVQGDQQEEEETQVMTVDDLREMRDEILKHLAVSLGEMSHAQQVLAALLAESKRDSHSTLHAQIPAQERPLEPQPNVKFSATLVSKPPPINSVQAFNAQVTIGGKDEALRHAASLFKASAESMERTRLAGEKYWVDALKIRRNNWGLVPAPLPFGAATGRGADKTSKDFLISFGLEESPPQFRRRAIGQLSSYTGVSRDIKFPHRLKSRLRVSVITKNETDTAQTTTNFIPLEDETSLEASLREAQREIVEQEIFSILVQEAGSLPTASARVSERLIVIDAAQGLELRFELEDNIDTTTEVSGSGDQNQLCDLIYYGLHILLIRRHTLLKAERLNQAGKPVVGAPTITAPGIPPDKPATAKYPILQPIIDLLQYQVFLSRIQTEIMQVMKALEIAGVPATLTCNSVGETGNELVKLLDDKSNLTVGGEIFLRIYDRHTIRFTFVSPSTLIAHLSQATLTLSSVPQLCQLLMDEVEHCLLKRVCDLGKSLSEDINGTWFIDLDRCVGRWEGSVLNFRLTYGTQYVILCSAFWLDHSTGKEGRAYQYSPRGFNDALFLDWAENIIRTAVMAANVDI